ncbi:MAG: ATP-dependent Clp protease ATP-binding subunit [Lachnospiraceae bacterium]|nr:ATP-dependent Clp protease ATP-binding subunit [Lachnospiraceae bacterium]
MSKPYTNKAAEAMDKAGRYAKQLHAAYIGTEHLLAGLWLTDCAVGKILHDAFSFESLELLMNVTVNAESSKRKVSETPELTEVIAEADRIAEGLNIDRIGTAHLMLGILRRHDCIAVRLLNSLHISLRRMTKDVLNSMDLSEEEMKRQFAAAKDAKKSHEEINEVCTDLTAKAEEGLLDPVIGRNEETERVIRILSRRTKNNPCMVGEPGVGKTAVVEGLAQRIVNGEVPEHLADKRIYTLNMTAMVAGAKYRGEFEERIRQLIDEVVSDGHIILFIDELHTIIGAGSAEGSLDAANILKPALSRGGLQIIGATTLDEYRKHIEKDAALERRFQPVVVDEPNEAENLAILKGLRSRYEKHHQVKITDEALEAAVSLSKRFISDRFLPDKAIDVMDEAASFVHLSADTGIRELTELQEQRRHLQDEKERLFGEGLMEEAKKVSRKQTRIENKIKALQEAEAQKPLPEVTAKEVAKVIASWTGIPIARVNESESEKLLRMEEELHKRVIGQEEAVNAIAKAVRRGRVGLKDPKRPVGSFLFLGPTGVGKTELCKALAEVLFGSEDALIRVDMSEYMEKHSVSKLIGSPPGYVGFDEGGQLSDRVRRKPYSVILFDEIEKAHPDVFNILLQVLDDGRITDSTGRVVNFKNTVIIMTSNAGAQSIIEPKKLGFGAEDNPNADYRRMKDLVMEEVKRVFRPEFLNRIDEIVVFHTLSDAELRQIVNLLSGILVKRCKEQYQITLTLDESVLAHIAVRGHDPKYGARPIKRAIQEDLEDMLADAILSGKIRQGQKVTVSYNDKGYTYG